MDELDQAIDQYMGDNAPDTEVVNDQIVQPDGVTGELDTPQAAPAPEPAQETALPDEYLNRTVKVERSGGRVVEVPIDKLAKDHRATLQSNYQMNQDLQRLRQELEYYKQYGNPQQQVPQQQYQQPQPQYPDYSRAPEPQPYDPYNPFVEENPQVKTLNEKYNMVAQELDRLKMEQRQREEAAIYHQQQQQVAQQRRNVELFADSLVNTHHPVLKEVPMASKQIEQRAIDIYNEIDFPGRDGHYRALQEAAAELADRYSKFRSQAEVQAANERAAAQIAANQGAAVQGAGGQQPIPQVPLPTGPREQEKFMEDVITRYMG